MSSRHSKPIISIARWLVPILVSILAFWLVLRKIDFAQFLDNLSKIGFRSLLLASLVYFASFLFRVICWYILLGRKVSFKDTFYTMNAGYLLNNVLPLRLGEVGRALLLDDPQGPSALEAFASVIVERIFDVFLAAVFVLSLLPRVLGAGYNQTFVLIAFVVAGAGILVLYLIARYPKVILNWLTLLGTRIPFVEHWIKPKAVQVLEGLAVLSNPISFLMAFGSLFISWILAFGQNYIIFNELYTNPPFWWMIFTLSAGTFGIALPSAPAGLGVFEGAMVVAFALLGLDGGIAFAHALIIHAMSFVYNNIFGLIGLHLKGEAVINLYHRAIKRSPNVQIAE